MYKYDTVLQSVDILKLTGCWLDTVQAIQLGRIGGNINKRTYEEAAARGSRRYL